MSRQVLADELFSEADDPMGALRWSLAELRRRTGLVDAFEGNPVSCALGAGTTADVTDVAAGVLTDDIPEGRFLEGIEVKGSPGFESWLLIERQRVDGEVLSALREATLRALSGRQFDLAVALAGAMLRQAPLDESSHVLLVKALASSGDPDAAIRQANASEALFFAELGVTATAAIRADCAPRHRLADSGRFRAHLGPVAVRGGSCGALGRRGRRGHRMPARRCRGGRRLR